MEVLSRLNKPGFCVFLRTLGWLLLFALGPAVIYGYTHSPWVGFKLLLGVGLISTLGLLWAFWAALFPGKAGDS